MSAIHLTPAQRKEKRGDAHHLDPVVLIGDHAGCAVPRKLSSMGGAGGYDMAMNLGIEMFASFDQYAWPVAYVALAALSPIVASVGGNAGNQTMAGAFEVLALVVEIGPGMVGDEDGLFHGGERSRSAENRRARANPRTPAGRAERRCTRLGSSTQQDPNPRRPR